MLRDIVEETGNYLFFGLHQNHIDRGEILLLAVALFAARNAVLLVGFTPASDRNQMIHGELTRREFISAMIAHAFAQLLLPPLGLAEFTSFGFFPFLMFGTGGLKIDTVHACT